GCSGFLGLLLGIFALITSEKASINIWSWLILYAVFIVDATVTLICRIIRGAPFYLAHRSHAYQILSRRWGSHLKVTLAVLGINIFWLFPLAFIAARYNEYAFVAVLVALTPLVWCAVKIGSGTGNI
ncbi:MAG: glycosyl transferase family 4, partial [Proteobacteria bacterium]|nr:glycosyl transferase family 4 [Pseudomonadota bacterium]